MNATNGKRNNGNNNNYSNNNNYGESYSYINKHGFRVNVRPIRKEGESKPVPSRGQRTHNFSPDAYLQYKSHPQTIKERHNKIEANRKQRILNAREQNKSAKIAKRYNANKTQRGPKGKKSLKLI